MAQIPKYIRTLLEGTWEMHNTSSVEGTRWDKDEWVQHAWDSAGPEARLPKRRRFTAAERQSILDEVPGSTVSAVARKHRIASRLLFSWRQQEAKKTQVNN